MADAIISYVDAKAQGLKRYRTGKPCKRGHFAERNVANCACVECQAAVTEQWGKENHELKLQFARDWHAENPGYTSDWARANPDKIYIHKRRWYETHTERAIEIALDWARRNPERKRTAVRNYQAKKRAAIGRHTTEEIEALLAKQNWICAAPDCEASLREKRDIDHIQAVTNGGSNDISNLQALCPSCNRSKNNKDMMEWIMLRALRRDAG